MVGEPVVKHIWSQSEDNKAAVNRRRSKEVGGLPDLDTPPSWKRFRKGSHSVRDSYLPPLNHKNARPHQNTKYISRTKRGLERNKKNLLSPSHFSKGAFILKRKDYCPDHPKPNRKGCTLVHGSTSTARLEVIEGSRSPSWRKKDPSIEATLR